MKMTDWKLIETLYLCKNITRTAEQLFLSQPTVSKRIQLMEEELGVSLIQRSRHGVIFTPEGEFIAVKAAQISALMEEIQQHITQSRQSPSGILHLGATNSATRSFLPELLRLYRLSHPNVEIDLQVRRSTLLAALTEKGALDLSFVNGDLPFSGEKFLYQKEQGYIACSFPFSLESLPSSPYITYQKDPHTDLLIENWWRQHFSSPFPHGLTVEHGDLARELVLKGLGYCIFFPEEYMFSHPEYIHRLTNLDGSPLIRNTWLYVQKRAHQKPAVRDFLQLAAPGFSV